jgi:hypothetical protein
MEFGPGAFERLGPFVMGTRFSYYADRAESRSHTCRASEGFNVRSFNLLVGGQIRANSLLRGHDANPVRLARNLSITLLR